jgi:hypothetical protein
MTSSLVHGLGHVKLIGSYDKVNSLVADSVGIFENAKKWH